MLLSSFAPAILVSTNFGSILFRPPPPPPVCFTPPTYTNYMLLYSTLLCKKIARAPGGRKKYKLTKLGDRNNRSQIFWFSYDAFLRSAKTCTNFGLRFMKVFTCYRFIYYRRLLGQMQCHRNDIFKHGNSQYQISHLTSRLHELERPSGLRPSGLRPSGQIRNEMGRGEEGGERACGGSWGRGWGSGRGGCVKLLEAVGL